MLNSYLLIGKLACIYSLKIALIIFGIVIVSKFLIKRKMEFKPLIMLSEFIFIFTVIIILNITGIIGPMAGEFGSTSIFSGNVQISVNIFEDGFSLVSILNIILFIPIGFFTPIIFKRLEKKWVYSILIGLIFSIIIEFLQSFVGRFVQLEDILMNTIGTLIGYEIYFWIPKLFRNK